MDLDCQIVQKLLAKYENSTHYRTGDDARSRRRVLLKLGPRSRDFNAYDIENVEQKEAVHASVARLKAAGLVDFTWERFNVGNVMAQVWLNLDRIDAAYAFAGLTPKRDIVDAMLADIQTLIDRLDALPRRADGDSINSGAGSINSGAGSVNADVDNVKADADSVHAGADNRMWVIPALRDMADRIASSHKWAPALPEEPDMARQFLVVLSALAQPDFVPTQVRVFSIQCFRDSKYLERALLPRLVSLVRKFHPFYNALDDEASAPDDLLTLIGLSRNPEIYEFCGPIKLTFMAPDSSDHNAGDPFNKAPIMFDYAAMPQGACLSSSSVDRIVAVEAPHVRRLLFIENRTNYEACIRSRSTPAPAPHPASQELVVFHGGFHSPAKLQFFRMIIAALPPDTATFHWGDIDLGGIRIFLQIRNDIAPNLRPWRMDAQTLCENKARALPFSQPYRAALEKVSTDPAFEAFHELIAAMLESGLRLEQESLI